MGGLHHGASHLDAIQGLILQRGVGLIRNLVRRFGLGKAPLALGARHFRHRHDLIRQDRATGELVFDLTYKEPSFDDTSRQRIWVDSQKHYTTKREWFAQDGHAMATFLYQDPMLQNGVWFPSKVVVKNVDDQVAGITQYTSVKVNSGLTTRPFQF